MPTDLLPASHCIRVQKVYDWITKPLLINIKEFIELEAKTKEMFSDHLCCDFRVPCGVNARTTLWTSYGLNKIEGSVCIKFHSGCGSPLDLYINGSKVASVNEGSTFSATYQQLFSIEAVCAGEKQNGDFCSGEFTITHHISSDDEHDICSVKDVKEVRCFFSDSLGQPLSEKDSRMIRCQELTSPEDRKTMTLLKSNGDKTKLQKVILLKQGFVTVQLINRKGKRCIQKVFPFSETETVFLCAPPGTKIECKITGTECNSYIIPAIKKHSACIEISIHLLIYQSITTVGDVKAEIVATECNPRKDKTLSTLCPKPDLPANCSFPQPPSC